MRFSALVVSLLLKLRENDQQSHKDGHKVQEHRQRVVHVVAVALNGALQHQLRVKHDEAEKHQKTKVDLEIEQKRRRKKGSQDSPPEQQAHAAGQESAHVQPRSTLRQISNGAETRKNDAGSKQRSGNGRRIHLSHVLNQRTNGNALQKSKAAKKSESLHFVLGSIGESREAHEASEKREKAENPANVESDLNESASSSNEHHHCKRVVNAVQMGANARIKRRKLEDSMQVDFAIKHAEIHRCKRE